MHDFGLLIHQWWTSISANERAAYVTSTFTLLPLLFAGAYKLFKAREETKSSSLPLVERTNSVPSADENPLLGEWLCTWQPMNDQRDTWVTEMVTVSWSDGRLMLKNRGNSSGYHYEGYLRLVEENYLLGRWYSLRKGATAHGVFSFALCPQGYYVCGYWTGPNDHGVIVFGKYVLGRNESSLETGKRYVSDPLRNSKPRNRVSIKSEAPNKQ